MTELFKMALEAARALPPDRQDELAGLILAAARNEPTSIALSTELRASLAASLGQAGRREFATDEEVAAVWRKHGL
jgi:hypothetical protein